MSESLRPPTLRLLQWLNTAVGFGSFLTVMMAVAAWNQAGWSASTVGLATTGAFSSYAVLVSVGGRLSDRWGRARTAVLGGTVAALGIMVAVIWPSPGTAMVAGLSAQAGAAIFFPGNVGLFSDAVAPVGEATLPLHRKLSLYNIGWSFGNLAGFVGYSTLAQLDTRWGFLIAAVPFALAAAVLWRWRALPPRPPAADGDRAAHPALARLTLLNRLGLLVSCILTVGMIVGLQSALQARGLTSTQAQAASGRVLVAYAIAYVLTFYILGRWSGWVLKPWRLLAAHTGFALGAAGVLGLALLGISDWWALALCGGCIGSAFAVSYTGSIYYSLRLPDGAARAAALHETALGIGNTIGPALCGAAVDALVSRGWCDQLTALGIFFVVLALAVAGVHVALIPGAVRAGAR